MSVSQTIGRHNRLLMGTALVGALLSSYARRAYAGSCTGGGGIFTCSGPADADSTQSLTGTPLTVTTTAGFGITTAVGDAFALTGTNGISFTDTNSSTIAGATNGITALNQGSGVLSITTTGLVTGAGTAPSNAGIYANNSGTDLTIHAAGVSGGYDGIRALNTGSGALSITTTGLVVVAGSSTYNGGILALNANGTDLTIQAAGVSGGADGISAANFGSGALSVTSTGPVTGTGTDTSNAGIVAYNAGTNLTVAASEVSGGHNGIFAYNNGSGILSITTTGAVTGANADGIYASNSGTDLTIQAADVSGSYRGIDARNLGSGALSITATGAVTVNTTGTNTTGIYAYNGINGTDLTIHAAAVSGGADGISAANFGSGALSITTTGLVTGSGTAPYNGGIVAFNANSASDLTIQAATVSGGSYGIYARNGGGALSITTTGRVESSGTATYNAGILAYNTVYGTNLTIAVADVSGANYGIFATNFGFGTLSITATGTVTGTGRYGIVAQDFLGVTDLTIAAANVSGGDDGIRAYHNGSGMLSITTTGAVTGSGRYGIFTTNGATGTQTLITVGATGSVAGANAGINAVSNAGQPIAITNAGTINNLAATPTSLAISTVNGPTTIANNGLVLGTVALGTLDDSFDNAATATWNTAGGANDFGAGNDAIVNNGMVVAAASAVAAEITTFANLETFRNNASGILTLHDGGTGDAAVLSGNYLGNGGRLLLDSFLAGDGSPSDRLVIDGGTATGTSALFIANTTGGGGLTLADGILVIDTQNGATTAPAAFSLGNRVAAGAFEYGLFRGGVSNAESWFLRSVFIPPSPQPPPGPPTPPGPPEPPVPNYRVEVPVDMALPALASRLGLGILGTYHERVGEDYADPIAPAEQQAAVYAGALNPYKRAVWGRVFGESGKYDNGGGGSLRNRLGSFLDNGPAYDFDMAGIQAGMDLYRRLNSNGSRDVAGFYLGYGRISADVDRVLVDGPAGTASVNGYSLGGYWTHIGTSGWYVDGVLQGTRYDRERGDSVLGEQLDTSGWGVAASLEGGYPFTLGNSWTLEPQAQLVYQHVSLDDGTDSFARIGFGDSDALYGRLGARLSKAMTFANGRRATGWLHADVWTGFGADADTTFSGLSGANPISFNTDIGGTWGSVGLGLSGEVANNVRLFATGDYNFGFDQGSSSSIAGNVGIKILW